MTIKFFGDAPKEIREKVGKSWDAAWEDFRPETRFFPGKDRKEVNVLGGIGKLLTAMIQFLISKTLGAIDYVLNLPIRAVEAIASLFTESEYSKKRREIRDIETIEATNAASTYSQAKKAQTDPSASKDRKDGGVVINSGGKEDVTRPPSALDDASKKAAGERERNTTKHAQNSSPQSSLRGVSHVDNLCQQSSTNTRTH